jgi:hypothetical protein
MVYGNLGDTSGTGVLFTRNPSTGEAKLYGEYLINAQGEDVVAGIRTPQPIAVMAKELPKAFAILEKNCEILEREYQDVMVRIFVLFLQMFWCFLGAIPFYFPRFFIFISMRNSRVLFFCRILSLLSKRGSYSCCSAAQESAQALRQ